MSVGGCDARKIEIKYFFARPTLPDTRPARWIVVLSPGCARSINKDGARAFRSSRAIVTILRKNRGL